MKLVLIVGAQRSGGWLVQKALGACGAWVGPTQYESADNRPIAEDIVQPFLRGISADPQGVWPLPQFEKHRGAVRQVVAAWRSRVLRSLDVQGADQSRLICIGSQTSLHLSHIWNSAFQPEEIAFVVARRDEREIERSLVKCGVNAGGLQTWDAEKWRAWHDAHVAAMEELRASGARVREVWPSTVIRDQRTDALESVATWLGLEWQPDRVSDAITPDLWRSGNFVQL